MWATMGDYSEASVWLWDEKPERFGEYYSTEGGAIGRIPNTIGLNPGECAEVRLVRVAERRTPSTGLPPVCDGAAALKIDPPGSVALPHAVAGINDVVELSRIAQHLRQEAAGRRVEQ